MRQHQASSNKTQSKHAPGANTTIQANNNNNSSSSSSTSVSYKTEVYAWGRNQEGQCGHTDTTSTIPISIERLKNKNVKYINAGYKHAAAVTEEGVVYTWGLGEGGRLGHGDEEDRPHPCKVRALKGKKIVSVACGQQHSVALSEDGRVYVWGRAAEGQCANVINNNNTADSNSNSTTTIWQPTLVSSLEHVKIIQIAAGLNMTLALADNGDVYFWGKFLLYSADTTPAKKKAKQQQQQQDMFRPILVKELSGKGVCMVSCGFYHAAALTANGDVYTWGVNNTNQLGHGPNNELQMVLKNNKMAIYNTPRLVQYFKQEGDRIALIACGGQQTACITDKDEVYMWGSLHLTNYGTVTEERFPSLPLMIDFTDTYKGVSKLALGSTHTIFAAHDGNTYGFGFGSSGAMEFINPPKSIDALKGKTVLQVSAGDYYSIALVIADAAESVVDGLINSDSNTTTTNGTRRSDDNNNNSSSSSTRTSKKRKTVNQEVAEETAISEAAHEGSNRNNNNNDSDSDDEGIHHNNDDNNNSKASATKKPTGTSGNHNNNNNGGGGNKTKKKNKKKRRVAK